MVYITGDTHAVFNRFNTKNFPEQKEMTKDDFVIVWETLVAFGTTTSMSATGSNG